MSNEIAQYLLDGYTLVIDNTADAYHAAVYAAREVVIDSEVTLSEYRAMNAEERESAYAQAIGDRIEELLDDWTRPMVEGATIGHLLIAQIYDTSGGWLKWSLGKHYMPDPDEADEFLTEGDD